MSLLWFRSRLPRDTKVSRQHPSDERLAIALAHIRQEGDLQRLPLARTQKWAIARNANRRHLITWNSRKQRYCLTGFGDAFIARVAKTKRELSRGQTVGTV